MRILHLADRFPGRGGADAFLLDWMAGFGSHEQRLCVGRGEGVLPAGVERQKNCSSLAAPNAQNKDLSDLVKSFRWADQIHLHNVMNPEAIRVAVRTGCASVIVQDHRIFCPGRGKERLDGAPCVEAMSQAICGSCFEDTAYGDRIFSLTEERRKAVEGGRLVVLSDYMADELAAVGLPGAQVHPPCVPIGPRRVEAGTGFLMGGRLVSHKGIAWGYAAWKAMQADAPLFFAGVGPESEKCPEGIQLGWLGQTELREKLCGIRALIFPGRWQEPFGILAAEALAEGTAVVGMRTGGFGGWAAEGVLLVDRGDVSGMSRALRFLQDEPQDAVELGQAGKDWVSANLCSEVLYPAREDWLAGGGG